MTLISIFPFVHACAVVLVAVVVVVSSTCVEQRLGLRTPLKRERPLKSRCCFFSFSWKKVVHRELRRVVWLPFSQKKQKTHLGRNSQEPEFKRIKMVRKKRASRSNEKRTIFGVLSESFPEYIDFASLKELKFNSLERYLDLTSKINVISAATNTSYERKSQQSSGTTNAFQGVFRMIPLRDASKSC